MKKATKFRMNRALLGFIMLTIMSPGIEKARANELGAGIIIGTPTAITGKYWMDSKTAIDFGLAFGLRDYILIYGDYLVHFPGLFGHKNKFVSNLQPYLGVGAIMLSGSSDRYDGDYYDDRYLGRRRSGSTFGIGVRVPVGAEWKPAYPTIGVFAEVVPGISVIPATYVWFQAGVGIRYYF